MIFLLVFASVANVHAHIQAAVRHVQSLRTCAFPYIEQYRYPHTCSTGWQHNVSMLPPYTCKCITMVATLYCMCADTYTALHNYATTSCLRIVPLLCLRVMPSHCAAVPLCRAVASFLNAD